MFYVPHSFDLPLEVNIDNRIESIIILLDILTTIPLKCAFLVLPTASIGAAEASAKRLFHYIRALGCPQVHHHHRSSELSGSKHPDTFRSP